MTDMNPLNLVRFAIGFRDAVERVSGHALNLPDTRFCKDFHEQIRYFFSWQFLNPHIGPQNIHFFIAATSASSGHTVANSSATAIPMDTTAKRSKAIFQAGAILGTRRTMAMVTPPKR